MSKHDHRVLKRFGETAGWLGIEFVDYLIVSTSDDLQTISYAVVRNETIVRILGVFDLSGDDHAISHHPKPFPKRVDGRRNRVNYRKCADDHGRCDIEHHREIRLAVSVGGTSN